MGISHKGHPVNSGITTRQTTASFATDTGNGHGSSSPPAPVPAGLIEIVLRHKRALLGSVLLAMLGAVAYLRTATPMYTSMSRIYVEQTGPKIIDDTEQGVMTRSMNYLHTQAELLTSIPIL